jgi:hypothetical protein
MKIEIDDDYVDAIVVEALAESYNLLKTMQKSKNSWHPKDIEHWKDLIPAIKLVGSHFSTNFKAAIKKAKKNEPKD